MDQVKDIEELSKEEPDPELHEYEEAVIEEELKPEIRFYECMDEELEEPEYLSERARDIQLEEDENEQFQTFQDPVYMLNSNSESKMDMQIIEDLSVEVKIKEENKKLERTKS